MNARNASGRTKPGISHAPVVRICLRPVSTNDQSRSTTSCTRPMLRSGRTPREALAAFAVHFSSHSEGNRPVNDELRIAEKQYGIVTRAQLVATGLSDGQIQR